MDKENKMDNITTEMMEHICYNLCKNTAQLGISKQEIEDVCLECKMGKYVCDILNTYNNLNNFEKTQCYTLLKKIPKWIPITEKLPEIGEDGYHYVMVCMDDGFIATTEFTKDGGFSLWQDSGEVVAWMPLPEPYKG